MRRLTAVAFGITFLLAACSESPAPTDPNLPVLYSANPSSSGATIVRGEDVFQFGIYDAENELLAFHNYRNAFPACGQTVTETTLGSFMEVHNGNDLTLFNALFSAPEAFITVWHSTNGSILSARCTTPIASGVGKLMYRDNDVESFLNNRARANAFMVKGEGTLTAPDGTKYHYNGMSSIVWQPDGVGGGFKESASVHIGPAGN